MGALGKERLEGCVSGERKKERGYHAARELMRVGRGHLTSPWTPYPMHECPVLHSVLHASVQGSLAYFRFSRLNLSGFGLFHSRLNMRFKE